jgi:WD40 repeat protein
MVYACELCVDQLLNPVLTLIQTGFSCKWAHDSQRFLSEFFDTIHNSPSQIYHSALLLSPSSSWIRKCYSVELSQEVKVVNGLSAEWGMWPRTVRLKWPSGLACWKDTIAVGVGTGDIMTLDGITRSQVALLSGHTKRVNSLTFSSDGTLLGSGSSDKTLKLWDVQTGGVVKTFHGHTGIILSVSISSNWTVIASGSIDKTIRLWDIQTGECHHTINQEQYMRHVCFSPTNPQHLISTSDGVVQQWDIDGYQIESTHQGYCAAFSLDGTHLASCGEKVTTIQNLNSGAIVAKFPTNSNPKYCCFSPNGRLVAVAVGSTAYVWDITGSDPHLIETFIGHTETINSLTFSSSSLISASFDQSIKFWQIGSSSMNLATSDPKSTPLTSAPIQSVSLQAENGIVISSDSAGVVKTWDLSTGLCKASFQTPATGRFLRDVQMIDGELVIVWLGVEAIHIWDTKKGELLQVANTDCECAKDLRISADGSKVFLLVGRVIQAWSIRTGEAVGEVEVEEEGDCLDLLYMDGSKICLRSFNSLTQGWDFGISGSSPIPLSNISIERPCLDFIDDIGWWHNGPSWIKDTATGKEVFSLSGRYAKPSNVRWDGRYLVASYGSGDLLILDFNQMLPQ